MGTVLLCTVGTLVPATGLILYRLENYWHEYGYHGNGRTMRGLDKLSCISLIGSFDCPQAVGKLHNTTSGIETCFPELTLRRLLDMEHDLDFGTFTGDIDVDALVAAVTGR